MFYFGVEAGIINILKSCKSSNISDIKLQINIDGLPVYKNSSFEIWPILGYFKYVNSNPSVIALFCGNGKPQPIEIPRQFYNRHYLLTRTWYKLFK